MNKLKILLLISMIGFSGVFSFQISAQEITIPNLEKPISQMTIPELQSKISEIMVAIQQLQTLLAKLQPGISGIPSGYVFSNTLKYGASSNEVIYLQTILNQDPDTQVSSTGWGSPGNESMYFGQKTLEAVIKFQMKYKTEISQIAGYTISGTGYVGPATIQELNQLLAQYRTGATPELQPDVNPPVVPPVVEEPEPINRAPILTTIGNKSINEDQQLTFTIRAVDPDGDILSYSVSNRPSGSSFNSTTRTFTWTPDYNQAGTHTLTFTVSDGSLTDTETITITVNNIVVAPVPTYGDEIRYSANISNVSGNPGNVSVSVPITLNNIGSREIIGIDIQLTYNSSLITAVDVQKGSLTQGWNLITNTNVAGEVKIVLYNSAKLTSGGEVAKVIFNIKPTAPVGSTSALILTKFNVNETAVNVLTNGTFTIQAIPLSNLDENKLNNLASILSVVQEIFKKIQSYLLKY